MQVPGELANSQLYTGAADVFTHLLSRPLL